MMRRVFFYCLALLFVFSGIAQSDPAMFIMVALNRTPSKVTLQNLHAYRQSDYEFECFDFTNQADVAITMLRVRFTYLSAQRKVVGFDTIERRGSFDPHSSITGPPVVTGYTGPTTTAPLRNYKNCQSFNRPREGLTYNVVSVDRVEFADGTSWTGLPFGTTPSPSPSPSASPNRI